MSDTQSKNTSPRASSCPCITKSLGRKRGKEGKELNKKEAGRGQGERGEGEVDNENVFVCVQINTLEVSDKLLSAQ